MERSTSRVRKPTVSSAWVAALLLGLTLVLTSCGLVGQSSLSRATLQPSAAPTVSRITKAQASNSKIRWVMTWHDEFTKPSSLNKWFYATGGDGWSLNQLQYYDTSNATLDRQGDLVI